MWRNTKKGIEDWHVISIFIAAVLGFAIAMYWSEPHLEICPLCGQEVVIP